jgi:Clostridial hydrophobic W
MPEAQAAAADKAPAQNQKMITELKVSGHLMTLDTGLFCIVQVPSRASDPATGLPGVRVSMPPGASSRPEVVSISTFRPDGWLYGAGDAALVRVLNGPAQVLVTIYQSPTAKDGAPNLQVLRLLEPSPAAAPAAAAAAPAGAKRAAAAAAAPVAAPEPAPAGAPKVMEMVAHIQERGDVGAMIGDWLGEKGSQRWIEGFGIAPTTLLAPKDIEYQAVLGKGWLSPWVEGGQFCGSRGMALPILGLRLRLRGEAADGYDVFYAATFVDGTAVGPVAAGEPCEAESLAPIEAFQVQVSPKGVKAASPAKAKEKPAAKETAKEAPKPKAPAAKEKPAAPTRKR